MQLVLHLMGMGNTTTVSYAPLVLTAGANLRVRVSTPPDTFIASKDI